MAGQPTPIKRSPQLAPLSREHHDGLLAVWKMRQGMRYGIEAARISRFIQWFLQQHLVAHFEKEESLLPAILAPSHPMIRQLFHEHEKIKALIHEAVQHGDLKKFEELAQALTDHIRFEERYLFGEVEKAASPAQLEALSAQLNDEKNGAVWEDEFWIKHP